MNAILAAVNSFFLRITVRPFMNDGVCPMTDGAADIKRLEGLSGLFIAIGKGVDILDNFLGYTVFRILQLWQMALRTHHQMFDADIPR